MLISGVFFNIFRKKEITLSSNLINFCLKNIKLNCSLKIALSLNLPEDLN